MGSAAIGKEWYIKGRIGEGQRMGRVAIGKEWLHQRKDTWRTTNGACSNRKGVATSKEG